MTALLCYAAGSSGGCRVQRTHSSPPPHSPLMRNPLDGTGI